MIGLPLPVIATKIVPVNLLVGATLVVARLRLPFSFQVVRVTIPMRYSERSEESKIHDRKTGQPVPRFYHDQEPKTPYEHSMLALRWGRHLSFYDFALPRMTVPGLLSRQCRPPLPFVGEGWGEGEYIPLSGCAGRGPEPAPHSIRGEGVLSKLPKSYGTATGPAALRTRTHRHACT